MSLQSLLERTGRFPPIALQIKSLQSGQNIFLDSFLSYTFDSSVVIPVDTFSFTFAAPDSAQPVSDMIFEGDICTLFANSIPLAVGIIDAVEIEHDMEMGEKVTINGRDLLAQFEDHSAISLDRVPLWGNSMTIPQAVAALNNDTRIPPNFLFQNIPNGSYLFATEPSESKLTALQRYLEPLNCLSWMNPSGKLVIGKPNMSQESSGRIVLSKKTRFSNVTNIKVTYAANTVPNIYVPIWAGQEKTQTRVTKEQQIFNKAERPMRLLKLGSRLPRTIVVSTPDGNSAQSLSDINQIQVAGSNQLQAYAKREMARDNMKAMLVQATAPGHYDENSNPYVIDKVYKIEYDRGGVDENMYLYNVQYGLDLSKGQMSRLFFCRLGTIVADNKAPGVS